MARLELTTAAVLGTLLVSVAAFAVGAALALSAGTTTTQVVPLGELPAGLVALDPAAWLGLGVIALLLTPMVRLGGMLRDFLRAGQRMPALSASVVLIMLGVSIVLGLRGRSVHGAVEAPAAVDSAH